MEIEECLAYGTLQEAQGNLERLFNRLYGG